MSDQNARPDQDARPDGHVIHGTPLVRRTNLRVTSMIRKALHDQPVLRVRGVWNLQAGEANPIAPALGDVDAAIARQGLDLAGPPYWVCPDGAPNPASDPTDDGLWPWEAGVPVDRAGVDDGRVEAATLPGGEVASIYYQGRFEHAAEVHAHLRAQLEAAGLEPRGGVRWIGLTDPATISDPDDHYSELIWPFVPAADPSAAPSAPSSADQSESVDRRTDRPVRPGVAS